MGEREHLLYQMSELDKGIILNSASIRNGVIQPEDANITPQTDLTQGSPLLTQRHWHWH